MSWGNVFNAEEREESFWPSFTDIMMVIVMTFLLVTVAVVMVNSRLLDELKSSLVAEQQASELAEFTLQENASLEDQLEYFQQRSSALEMELLRSRAQTEATRTQLAETETELSRLQLLERRQTRTISQQNQQFQALQSQLMEETTRLQGELETTREQLGEENTRLQVELEQVQQTLSNETARLQNELEQTQNQLAVSRETTRESEQALSDLRTSTVEERQKLLSLEGDYAELDKKYQKLLKPTRSSKGKTIAEVMYRRSGYRIRGPGENDYRNVSRPTLDSELEALKVEYGNDLYVKIIIPENSGLSYNQAWAFTRDTLNRYDYYYQEDMNVPADEDAEDEEALPER